MNFYFYRAIMKISIQVYVPKPFCEERHNISKKIERRIDRESKNDIAGNDRHA